MSKPSPHHVSAEPERAFSPTVLRWLELLDNLAHIVVAVMFILMAAIVLIHSCYIFAQKVHLVANIPQAQEETAAPHAPKATSPGATGKDESKGDPATGKDEATGTGTANSDESKVEKPAAKTEDKGHEAAATSNLEVDPFYKFSLELLSSILYAVIILELLRTIITYLQTHDIQAIMQEFMVVGIISSVRKILLVGAAASLSGSSGIEFIQEATGVLLNIGGILLLIMGLVLLRRGYGKREKGESVEHSPISSSD